MQRSVKVNTSMNSYKVIYSILVWNIASRRVKNLSLPKGWSQCYCASELYDLGGGESCQSDSRLHKLSASKICQTIRPKDYRYVKYLDVYRIGKQFPANDTTHHKSQQPYHHANKC